MRCGAQLARSEEALAAPDGLTVTTFPKVIQRGAEALCALPAPNGTQGRALSGSFGQPAITRPAELSRRLGWKRESVDRLFRLDHASRLEQL